MKYLLFILSFFITLSLFSQTVVCGTDEYNSPFIKSNPTIYENIERDIQNHLRSPRQKSGNQYVIPVVFHVLWQDNNENIPDSVIHQQIEVLNEAFNAENADTAILTDTLKNWVGDFGIRFELAYTDPDGFPTSGITRTHTEVAEWSYWGNYMKFDVSHGKDAWPTDRYLNIWVCDLYGGLLGYAQFPGGPKDTDGLVFDWQVTGNQIYPWTYPNIEDFAGGRVGVHEVGHWLNLFHPWGNNGMCSEDHIPETGLQTGPVYPSAGCPDTLISNCDPSERVFVKHYMDYCGNSCMVCFTKNQVLRGLASLETYRMPMIENYQPRPTISEFEDIKINPTYTKGRLYIEFPPFGGKLELEIYDMLGRKVYYEEIYQRFKEVYLNNPSGTYIISVKYNGERVYKKKIVISSSSPFGATLNNEDTYINKHN